MGRSAVTAQEEIEANVAYFWGLGNGQQQVKLKKTAGKMLAAAHNLVGVSFDGIGILFAPSRFAGYTANTFEAHKADPYKDGGVTDPAISRVLDAKPGSEDDLEAEYLALCRRHDVKPHDRERDYWPVFEAGSGSVPTRPKWLRLIPPRPATVADQVHNRIQERLFHLLRDAYGPKCVFMEKDFVDLRVSHPDLEALIEVKSDHNPRYAIRQALGQLLDYAFAASKAEDAPADLLLVVAAPGEAGDDALAFLNFIQAKTGLDLRYVTIQEDTKKCPL